VRLFQFSYSPFAAKVRKCLELKGLAFEAVEVPYLDRRELVALTGGYVHVPVLEDGGAVITDSAPITAWLDERYPPSLRGGPHGPLAEVVEQWADQVLEDVAFRLAVPPLDARYAALQGGREDARALFRLVKERKFGAGCIEAWDRDAAGLSSQLAALLAPLVRQVGRSPFLLGDAASLADAAVWGQLFFVEQSRPGWIAREVPGLSAWYERVAAT
jgi:glutathione S-transferase